MSKTNFSFTIPESWEEVPQKVLPFLALLFLKTEKEMPLIDRQVRAFVLLAGMKNYKNISSLSDENLYDLLPAVDWVFDKPNLLSCKLKKITSFFGKDLIAPEDGMNNLRFGEFIFADSLFWEYGKNRDENVLNKFVATLYRPLGKGDRHNPKHVDYCGDLREKFNSNIIDSRAKRLRTVSKATKELIFFWYFCSMKQIRNNHKEVFPEGKKNNDVSEPDYGWIGVYDEIRGDKGRTGDDLEEEFLSTVLLSLQRNALKYKKLKPKAA